MRLALAALLCLGCAPARVPIPGDAHRVEWLFAHPEAASTQVTLAIVEPLHDHTKGTGRPRVWTLQPENVGPHYVYLVAGVQPAMRKVGALAALPADLAPPLVVRGYYFPHDGDAAILVTGLSRAAFPAPEHVAEAAVLAADPARWDGHYIEVDATWRTGFEVSFIDPDVALETYEQTNYRCTPEPPSREAPFYTAEQTVRVAGYAYTAAGRYGPQSRKAKVVATRIVYLEGYCRDLTIEE